MMLQYVLFAEDFFQEACRLHNNTSVWDGNDNTIHTVIYSMLHGPQQRRKSLAASRWYRKAIESFLFRRSFTASFLYFLANVVHFCIGCIQLQFT